MRIVVFGTGPFCVPTMQSLANSENEILCAVTRPIEDAGKRRKTAANPVRESAEKLGLEVLDPQSCNEADFVQLLKSKQADLFFVCDYGQILSKACLSAARLGGINLHGSLLPKYRGAAPVQWAIYNGDQKSGVTVIHMTPRLDAGPNLAQLETEILDSENSDQLESRLSEIGVDAVHKAISLLANWDGESAIGSIQDSKKATKAPRINKSDGKIDWNRSAKQIVDQIRAFTPWPTSFCTWSHGKQPLRLIVHQATTMQIETDAPPGTVIAIDKKLLAIQTAEDALVIQQLQPAGKKSMPVTDFLRGSKIAVGQLMD